MSRDVPLLVDILSDELKNPAFNADELAKAKKELENDYLQAADNTFARAFERLTQVVYREGQP